MVWRVFIVLMVPLFLTAQFRCGLQQAIQMLKTGHSDAYRDGDELRMLPQKVQANGCYTVPVVFHVLHLNGQENISDAQIQDALRILNEDFRKMNADTVQIVPTFKSFAADACIQFSLASIDPEGKCTKGILRHYDTLTNWTTINPLNYKYGWPSGRYLNIYVVRQLPPGIGGYAYLPGTVGPAMDGVVILHNMVGSIGTSLNYSRALTHEVGHMFGLLHVWGSGNVGVACGDDGVSDTPVTKGWTFCNLSSNQMCNPGTEENVQNYMEYAFCSNMFTQGQKMRMHQIIQNNIASRGDLVSAQNLSLAGAVNPVYNCPPRPQFLVSPAETNVGGSVILKDISDYDAPNFWHWKSDKSFFSYSQPTVTMQFHRAGFAYVFLKCGNSYGLDSVLRTNVVAVQSTVGGIVNLTYDMENWNWPDTIWFGSEPDMVSGFKVHPSVGCSGNKSLYVDVYNDYPASAVNLYFPMMDVSSLTTPVLEFNYASAQMQSGSQANLKVWAKAAGSPYWTLVSSIFGSSLHTGGTTYQNFIPSGPSDWKKAQISLSGFQSVQNLLFKLEFVPDPNGRSNNFFLDDIRVGNPAGWKKTAKDTFSCRTGVDAEENLLRVWCVQADEILSWNIVDMHVVKRMESLDSKKLKNFEIYTSRWNVYSEYSDKQRGTSYENHTLKKWKKF